MNSENLKKKKEELVQQHNTLKDKIDEAKTAIANMQAQLNGLVGAVQLCDQLINDSEKQNSKKDK
jgi:chaperonin cofactor prefoldin|tara:strand:- start:75 stop:269 length:195 start_codon:yes stop_codon:yes gene_type:complete